MFENSSTTRTSNMWSRTGCITLNYVALLNCIGLVWGNKECFFFELTTLIQESCGLWFSFGIPEEFSYSHWWVGEKHISCSVPASNFLKDNSTMLLLVVPEKIVNLFESVLFSLIWCRYWANSKLNMAFARPDMCKFFVMSCHCSSKVAKGVLGGGFCQMNSHMFFGKFLSCRSIIPHPKPLELDLIVCFFQPKKFI